MAIGRRALAVGSALAFAASLAGLAISAHTWHQAKELNARIADGEVNDVEDGAPPQARFAKAYQLRARGELDAALKLYQQLEQVPDRQLQLKASYNIGNIYVTRAQIDAQFARYKDIGTLVGIARAQYQRALRIDSDFYDAKYNLEYTRFLVTERDSENQKYEGGLGREHERRKMQWAEFQPMPKGLP